METKIQPMHVRQKGRFDCGPACLSMITGISLDIVIQDLSLDLDLKTGISYSSMDIWLAENGYAVSRIYQAGRGNTKTAPWPPEPWADVHLAQVRVRLGWHFVLWLRDGTILDPDLSRPIKFGTLPYIEVANIAGVHRFRN